MRIRIATMALLCACATQQIVQAHPGHAVQPEAAHGLSHYLTHPDHVAQWLIVAIVVSFGIYLLRSIKRPAPAYARKDATRNG